MTYTLGEPMFRWVSEAARLARKLRADAEYVATVGADAAGYGDDTDAVVGALRGVADEFEEAVRRFKRGCRRRALAALKAAYGGYTDLGGENAAIREALEHAQAL